MAKIKLVEKNVREGKTPFKITDVKCSQRWVAEVGDRGITISCKINGVPCQFPFGAARWGKLVGGLGIDCDEVLFPGTHPVWPERERISTGGGGQNYYALFISDSVVTSQPKENQKDFLFIGQLYSTAPIVKAFRTKLMELYDKGLLTQKFLERVGAAEASAEEARKGKAITFIKKKMRGEGRRANEARMLQGNNYSYHRDFAGKSGSIGDLRLYDDGKMTFTSYNSKRYPSAAWMFKDLDTAKTFYSALDYKLADLSYGNISDDALADYLSRKYANLRVEA